MKIRRLSPLKWQISLGTLFFIVTVCAVGAWVYVQIGFIAVVAPVVAIMVGCLCGVVVGSCCRSIRSSILASSLGSVIAIVGFVTWLIMRAIHYGEFALIHELSPVVFLIRYEFLLILGAVGLVGAIPFAIVGAVYNRDNYVLIGAPTFVCSALSFVIGCVCIAIDYLARVEARRRFGIPINPPIPYPIAVMLPLFAATLAGGALGFVSGLSWIAMRTMLERFSRWQGRFRSITLHE